MTLTLEAVDAGRKSPANGLALDKESISRLIAEKNGDKGKKPVQTDANHVLKVASEGDVVAAKTGGKKRPRAPASDGVKAGGDQGPQQSEPEAAPPSAKKKKKEKADGSVEPPPIDIKWTVEADDAVDGDSCAAEDDGSDVEAPVRLKLATQASMCSDCGDDLGDSDEADEAAWRRGLEELRRRRDSAVAAGEEAAAGSGGFSRPKDDELARTIVRLLDGEGGSWPSFLGVQWRHPHPSLVGAALEQLSNEQLASLLLTCAERYKAHMFERPFAGLLIDKALAVRGQQLVRVPEVREALRSLLRSLTELVGGPRKVGRVAACLGKWRLVQALAASRQETLAQASAEDGLEEAAVVEDADDSELADTDDDA